MLHPFIPFVTEEIWLKNKFDKLNKNALVFDVVYNPLETNLLKQTRKRGNKTINGLRMLLYQAQGGFKAWFHKKPKITKELENLFKEEIK